MGTHSLQVSLFRSGRPGAASLAPAFNPCSTPRTMNGQISWQPGPSPETAGCPSRPPGNRGGMGARLSMVCGRLKDCSGHNRSSSQDVGLTCSKDGAQLASSSSMPLALNSSQRKSVWSGSGTAGECQLASGDGTGLQGTLLQLH